MKVVDFKIDQIIIGERHRKQLGDIEALAHSIAEVGLLHPVVVTPDGELISGQRRLAAVTLLGWVSVPVTVVDLGSKPTDLVRVVESMPEEDKIAAKKWMNASHNDALETIYRFNQDHRNDYERAGKCAVCGYSAIIHQHHFLPVSSGGQDDPRNMIPLCPTHHSGVHKMMRPLSERNVKDWMDFTQKVEREDPALKELYYRRISWLAEVLGK